MKGNRAFIVGGVVGSALSVVSLVLHMSRIALLFGTLSILGTFSAISILLFTLRGWPRRHILSFDIYDFFRLLLGGTFAIITVCFMITAIEQTAKALSISFALAGLFSAIAISSYFLVLYIVIDYLRRGRRTVYLPSYRLNPPKRQRF